MLSAWGASTKEWTRWCVSFLDSNGWSILKDPLPLDKAPATVTAPPDAIVNLVEPPVWNSKSL